MFLTRPELVWAGGQCQGSRALGPVEGDQGSVNIAGVSQVKRKAVVSKESVL